jgi:two-component system, OmpR family, response regulator RegX3
VDAVSIAAAAAIEMAGAGFTGGAVRSLSAPVESETATVGAGVPSTPVDAGAAPASDPEVLSVVDVLDVAAVGALESSAGVWPLTVTDDRVEPPVSSTCAFTIAAAELAASTPTIDRMVAVRVFTLTRLEIDQPAAGSRTSKKRPRDRAGLANCSGDAPDSVAAASRMHVVKILLVEDDNSIAVSLVDGLVDAGYEVLRAATGSAALEMESTASIDVVLLDLGLPDMDGRDVCRVLRGRSRVPIIMLTARSDEFDRVLGLELGADDYVTKPFSFRELVARIRAVARRVELDGVGETGGDEADRAGTASGAQQIGSLEIDRRTRRVSVDGEEVYLTAKEFDLLAHLARDPGAVSTRTEILENVWDAHWYGPTKTVDAHVAALRKKLGDHGWIEAVRGVGFRLEVPS